MRIEAVAAIDCDFAPRDWPFAREQRRSIEATWRRESTGNPHMFNGRVLLLHEGESAGAVFRGAFLEADYKAFLHWHRSGFPDKSLRNCFAMAALRSSDGAFMLGEMGAHTSQPGRIYFPAGTPDPKDVEGGKVDLGGSVARELMEETGLGPPDVTFAPGWTLVHAGQRIACMKVARSPLDARAILARAEELFARERAAGIEPELARLHVWRRPGDVDAARMPDFMAAYLAAQAGLR